MEDDRVAILENQLAQAKLIAEEADKKYEEVQPPLFILTRHYHYMNVGEKAQALSVGKSTFVTVCVRYCC